MTPQQILESMPQNTVKAVVFNVMRSLERENWFEWRSGEALTWTEKQMITRGYSSEESQALALLTLQQFLKSRNA